MGIDSQPARNIVDEALGLFVTAFSPVVTPPGPTRVTRRAAVRADLTSWTWRRRPMKLVSSTGRFPRVAVTLPVVASS